MLCLPFLCMHPQFNKHCLRGSILVTSPRPNNTWLLIIISPVSPYPLRHWQPCTPFRLHSTGTYTRPPYPGATRRTPSPPPSLHYLRAFSLPAPTRELLQHLTICAHSRCLRSYTSPANHLKLCLNLCAHPRCLRSFATHYITSLPTRIPAACAHTHHLRMKHRGTSLPRVFHLTRGTLTGLITQ